MVIAEVPVVFVQYEYHSTDGADHPDQRLLNPTDPRFQSAEPNRLLCEELPKHIASLATTHALGNQQDSMKPMIIAGLI